MEIIDTTLRDGLQSPLWDDHGKYYPTLEEKLDIFDSLVRYGVRYVELFSPLVNDREASDLPHLIKKKHQLISEIGQPVYLVVHCRCHPADISAALEHKIDGLNFYIGTSRESQKFNHGKKISQIVTLTVPILKKLRASHPHLQLRFSGEDAFRTPLTDLFAVYDAVAPFVDRLGFPDTVGVGTPEQVNKRALALKKRYPNIPLEGHFHNDRGLSLANSLTAIDAGLTYIDTSVLGLAERSGITSLTALVFNLAFTHPNLVENFTKSSSYGLNVLVADILRTHVPPTEPVSLTNRTHSAGVHGQAVLKHPGVYEAHHLEEFGVSDQRLLLYPLSGKHIIHYYLSEVLNFVGVDEDLADQITKEFKNSISRLAKRRPPTALLKQIAKSHRLAQVQKPVSHVEVLS